MSRTPKWIRYQLRAFRGSDAQERRLRYLWRHTTGRNLFMEIMAGSVLWTPQRGRRF